MRKMVSLCVAACLMLGAAPPVVHSQSGQELLQGTQVRLVLLNGITSSVARDGDPFLAVVSEPVYLGGQLLLPAGTRVNGVIANVEKTRYFSVFRGGAGISVVFRSIEMDGREIPAQMSILSIHETSEENGKRRRDLRIEEGAVIEARRDIKGDVATVGLGGGGGSIVGSVFGKLARGLAFGLIGGTAWVVAKKGKEVELPAKTGFLVRMDNTVTLPAYASAGDAYRSTYPNN